MDPNFDFLHFHVNFRGKHKSNETVSVKLLQNRSCIGALHCKIPTEYLQQGLELRVFMHRKLRGNVALILAVHHQRLGTCSDKANWCCLTGRPALRQQCAAAAMLCRKHNDGTGRPTWHGGGDQQLDLTLLLLHGLLQVLEEETLHVAHHLPQEGERGRDGVHPPFAGCPHKVHDQTHLHRIGFQCCVF